MSESKSSGTPHYLVLHADTAADLMSRNPVSLNRNATVPEAASFLVDREISAAPVIDDAGRPVGVLSQTDIVRYERESDPSKPPNPDFYHVADLFWPPAIRKLMHVKKAEHTLVSDIMTPTVLKVSPEDTALAVVAELLALKVHRLFVVDASGVLVGVISTFDVLRKLQRRDS